MSNQDYDYIVMGAGSSRYALRKFILTYNYRDKDHNFLIFSIKPQKKILLPIRAVNEPLGVRSRAILQKNQIKVIKCFSRLRHFSWELYKASRPYKRSRKSATSILSYSSLAVWSKGFTVNKFLRAKWFLK